MAERTGSPSGVSDGTKLNLAAQLAETAAELQRIVTARKSKTTDPTMVASVTSVHGAVRCLCAAVQVLVAEVEREGGT